MTRMETPIIFGTGCLGNLYKVVPFETKVEIAAEWFKAFPKPFIDSAGKYGAGLSLECIGKALRVLDKNACVWDSGRVESAEMLNLPYAGAALAAERRYDWTVTVWDERGETVDPSRPRSVERRLIALLGR